MNEIETTDRERVGLDFGWKFHRGDVVVVKDPEENWTYMATKAGHAVGAAGIEWDDSGWSNVDLPHDWAVAGDFDRTWNVDHGYRPRGVGWYRRRFQLAEADRGRRIGLEFDGVLTHATVWVNGVLVKRHFGGYMGFWADITDIAEFGEKENVVSVRVDATEFEGWWYEGAGIYRHVWLTKTPAVHAERWGIFVKPVRTSGSEWQTHIETAVANEGDGEKHVRVRQRIFDTTGQVAGETESEATVGAWATVTVRQMIRIQGPRLWSIDEPSLYRLETHIESGAGLDRVETTFGYRHLRFDAEKGFFLNDRPVKIHGMCNHQDHAGVGAAVPDALWEYRIRRLKAMGCNAHRCAHNPPAPEFLDACDRLGMLVLDENRQFRVSDDVMEDLEGMVKRDRNHPSVFLWSIYNEEHIQERDQGASMARTMQRAVKALDDSRPVTAAVHHGVLAPEGVGRVLEVMGINYIQDNYDTYHKLCPGVPICATEMTAAFSTRGQYAEDAARGYCDAYDRMAPKFGTIARTSWRMVAEREFVMGGFIWTGFDYRGEPAPYKWPCINSHFGVLDTCGFAKDVFYLYRAMWTDEPMVHVLPHWNWAGREGEEIKVWCYSNCEETELFLNGKSLGIRKVGRFEPAEWMVAYQPGVLRAEARKGGRTVAVDEIQTTGPAVRLVLEADRTALRADGRDATVVAVKGTDAAGRLVPTADNKVKFSISGPGKIIGVGNGDPSCHERDKAGERSLFNGLAQVVLQSGREPGRMVIQAQAEDLASGEVAVEVGSGQ